MKKLISILGAVVLSAATVLTAFAAPSKQVTGVVEGINKVVDPRTGEQVTGATIKNLDEVPEYTDIKDKVAEIKGKDDLKDTLEKLGVTYEDGMQVVDIKVVEYPEGFDLDLPLQFYFDVEGVTADSVVKVLLYNTETEEWEVVECEVIDGQVIVTLDGPGILAFVVKNASVSASGSSPKTGEMVNMLPVVVAMIAVAGMGFSLYMRRRKVTVK